MLALTIYFYQSQILRMFSIVLPKTLLFMGLKMSFANEFFAWVLFCVLKSIYSFNHGDWSNSNTRCALFSFNPKSMCNCKYLQWRTYLFLLLNVGTLIYALDWLICCISLLFFDDTLTTYFQWLLCVLLQLDNHYEYHAALVDILDQPLKLILFTVILVLC